MAQRLPSHIPIEEETIPGYNPKRFLHPDPGDVLGGRYELKAKIGFGTTSTVWMAEDLHSAETKDYVAIKICTSDTQDAMTAQHELEMSKRIVGCSEGDEGKYQTLLTVDDSFEVAGHYGQHLCLVMDMMREPIWLMRRRLCGGDQATLKTIVCFKLYILEILSGLQYLHEECKLVHTDLKLDNIMVGFEDKSVMDEFAAAQAAHPMARKEYSDGHRVYLSHNNFGALRRIGAESPFFSMCLKIVDFGLAQRADMSAEPLLFPIQGNQFQAPEVLLGTGWSYSADIWNLGVLIWELLSGDDLFSNVYDKDGVYSAKHHLAEMISLLGPIPQAIIKRERDMRPWRWAPEITNSRGELCSTAASFYGGPFIDDNAQFIDQDLVTCHRSLLDLIPQCISTGLETDDFIDFILHMLCWDPEKRMSAAQLQEHPWLTRWQTPPDQFKA